MFKNKNKALFILNVNNINIIGLTMYRDSKGLKNEKWIAVFTNNNSMYLVHLNINKN